MGIAQKHNAQLYKQNGLTPRLDHLFILVAQWSPGILHTNQFKKKVISTLHEIAI